MRFSTNRGGDRPASSVAVTHPFRSVCALFATAILSSQKDGRKMLFRYMIESPMKSSHEVGFPSRSRRPSLLSRRSP